MTFAHVLLLCLGALAGCATLVFAVETLVAFWFHEPGEEQRTVASLRVEHLVAQTPSPLELPVDKAA